MRSSKYLDSLVRASDMAPLAERMGHLQALRLSFAVIVMAGGAASFIRGDTPPAQLTWLSIVYVVLTACVEGLRRIGNKRRLSVVAAMLLIDGVFVAAAIDLTGIIDSPLRILVYLHLIAVTLLASYRTGIKIAFWHSLLLLVVFFADRAGTSPQNAATAASLSEGVALAMYIGTYWLVAIGTAVYSSLNERELRRNRAHLEAQAEMATELEATREAPAVATILLREIIQGFGCIRGVVLGADAGGGVAQLASHGTSRALPTAPADSVIRRAWEEKRVLLVKALDERADPRLHETLRGAHNLLVAPMLAEDHPVGALVAEFGGRINRVESRTIAVVGQLVAHAALALQNARLHEQLRKQAEADPLTNLANRRTFEGALERELARATRKSEQVALVMLDLDHFKSYNDTYGHQAGDDLLRATGRALKDVSREYDTIARYGGEEFAVILPACSPAGAEEFGHRLRESICAIQALTTVTASAGVAVFPLHGGDPTGLIRAADEALYESKRQGRNRVTVAGSGSLELVSSAK